MHHGADVDRLGEGLARSHGHRHFWAPGDFEHGQRVAGRVIRGGVAMDRTHRQDLHVGLMGKEQRRQRIVDPVVAVQNQFVRRHVLHSRCCRLRGAS